MINTYLNYLAQHKDSVDAILIANREGIIEYSAILSDKTKEFVNEGIIGQHLLDVYPSLTDLTSSHSRVLKSGQPIINEKQIATDNEGNIHEMINSTFPIRSHNEIIGTFEATIFLDHKVSIRTDLRQSLYTIEDIIGNNPQIVKLKEILLQLASSNTSVLISGETGTGKELFAQALHHHSIRHSGPFVSINVAAIPDNLLESTLFGTEKGSFTDATDKQGLFEEAHMGTLFLDELDSMSLSIQSKILRAIETQTIRRVGGTKDIKVDIRFISAMNVKSEEAIRNKNLRPDLFYRLAASQIVIPPLKDRAKDIELLTNRFLPSQFKISPMVRDLLSDYQWPGNIRELKNVIHYAVNIAKTETITVQDIPEYILFNRLNHNNIDLYDEHKSLAQMTGDFEKQIIKRVLSESRTLTEASNKLQLTRQALRYK